MEKPDSVTINVRQYAGTYIAQAKKLKVRASCTESARSAAHACAYKIYGMDQKDLTLRFTLKKVTDVTYIAEAVQTESRPDPECTYSEPGYICGFARVGGKHCSKPFGECEHQKMADNEPKKPSAWRTDLPDDEIDVLVRTREDDYPLVFAFHTDGVWLSSKGQINLRDTVTGWMHLEEAARILDSSLQPTA